MNEQEKELQKLIDDMRSAQKEYEQAFYAGESHDKLNILYAAKEEIVKKYKEFVKKMRIN